MVVGEIPVNVEGFLEALIRVIVEVAKCEGSALEFTTTSTVVGLAFAPEDGLVSVGTVAGAVNTPLLSIDPQFGLQEAAWGFAVWFAVVVEPVYGCVTSHTKFEGGEFCNEAVNFTTCAGVTPTGTVAVEGLTVTRIPESRVTLVVPVFL